MSFSTEKRSWFSWLNCSLHRKPRPIRLTLEALEDRLVLSTLASTAAQAGPVLNVPQTSFQDLSGSATPAQGPSAHGYSVDQMRQAYGWNFSWDIGGKPDGSGQTIAIIDAYDDPNIWDDLYQFDQAEGLPAPPSFQVIWEDGNRPPQDPNPIYNQDGEVIKSSEMEESLDVEWAHAMAPGANIMLFEAKSLSSKDLYVGAQWAATQPGVSVVSMSFGTNNKNEENDDSYFQAPPGHAGVTFVASAGDNGQFRYPASSDHVLAVGGTTLTLADPSSGNYGGETVWNDGNGSSGGGQDKNYPYKNGPDVAYNAGAPVQVYDSFDRPDNPWIGEVGTSAGAPQWAALIAIADQARALQGMNSLDGESQTIPMLWDMVPSAFHTDISGENGNNPPDSGKQVIGMGTPIADRVVAGFSGLLQNTSGTNATANSGQTFTGAIATFHDYSGPAIFSAVINWGNGATSTGQVVNEGNGYYAVVGSNNYANPGTYTISVQVHGSDGTAETIESTMKVDSPSQSTVPRPPTLQDDSALLFEGFEFELDQYLASIMTGYGAAAGQMHASAESNPAWNTPMGHLFWQVGMMLAEQALSGYHNS